jgi:hypothetical protein
VRSGRDVLTPTYGDVPAKKNDSSHGWGRGGSCRSDSSAGATTTYCVRLGATTTERTPNESSLPVVARRDFGATRCRPCASGSPDVGRRRLPADLHTGRRRRGRKDLKAMLLVTAVEQELTANRSVCAGGLPATPAIGPTQSYNTGNNTDDIYTQDICPVAARPGSAQGTSTDAAPPNDISARCASGRHRDRRARQRHHRRASTTSACVSRRTGSADRRGGSVAVTWTGRTVDQREVSVTRPKACGWDTLRKAVQTAIAKASRSLVSPGHA